MGRLFLRAVVVGCSVSVVALLGVTLALGRLGVLGPSYDPQVAASLDKSDRDNYLVAHADILTGWRLVGHLLAHPRLLHDDASVAMFLIAAIVAGGVALTLYSRRAGAVRFLAVLPRAVAISLLVGALATLTWALIFGGLYDSRAGHWLYGASYLWFTLSDRTSAAYFFDWSVFASSVVLVGSLLTLWWHTAVERATSASRP